MRGRSIRYRARTARVTGSIGTFGTKDSLVAIAQALNHNADLLETVLDEIDALKAKVKKLEEAKNENMGN